MTGELVANLQEKCGQYLKLPYRHSHMVVLSLIDWLANIKKVGPV